MSLASLESRVKDPISISLILTYFLYFKAHFKNQHKLRSTKYITSVYFIFKMNIRNASIHRNWIEFVAVKILQLYTVLAY